MFRDHYKFIKRLLTLRVYTEADRHPSTENERTNTKADDNASGSSMVKEKKERSSSSSKKIKLISEDIRQISANRNKKERKYRHFTDRTMHNSQKAYKLSFELAIDESMIAFQGISEIK